MQRIKDFWSKNLVNKIIVIVGAFMFVCFGCAFVTALFSPSQNSAADPAQDVNQAAVETIMAAGPTEQPLPTNTNEPTITPAPTDTPIPTATPDPNLIAPGTYLVNVDIQPGIYRGLAGSGLFSSCYWERLKDLTGSFEAILSNDNGIGQFYVEVKGTDYALKTDCDLVRLDPIPQHVGDYPQVISAGTYLVGYDIQPGTYRGQTGTEFSESCYWERVRNVAGGFDAILANDNGTGQYYVQILPSDFALKTACDLERVGE